MRDNKRDYTSHTPRTFLPRKAPCICPTGFLRIDITHIDASRHSALPSGRTCTLVASTRLLRRPPAARPVCSRNGLRRRAAAASSHHSTTKFHLTTRSRLTTGTSLLARSRRPVVRPPPHPFQGKAEVRPGRPAQAGSRIPALLAHEALDLVDAPQLRLVCLQLCRTRAKA